MHVSHWKWQFMLQKKRVFYFITFILRVKWFCCVWNWLASPWFLLEGLKRLLWLVTADAFLTRVTVKPWSTKHFVPLLRWNMIKSRVRPTLFLQKLSEWHPPPPPWTLNVFFLFPKNGWKCKNLSCIVVFGSNLNVWKVWRSLVQEVWKKQELRQEWVVQSEPFPFFCGFRLHQTSCLKKSHLNLD